MTHPLTTRSVHTHQNHFGWSRDTPVAMTVAPGERVEIDVIDGGGGQISPDSTTKTIADLDFDTLLPLTGPIAVDDAEPGDTLKVTLLDLSPSGWGWSAIIPGFGILAEEFTEPALHIWRYEKTGRVPAAFGAARVPLKPFPGTLGVAPSQPGIHSALPPRNVGGNLDTRDIAAGCSVYFPIEVEGALFSVGDTHAAQGDGELAGSAIESPMKLTVQLDVIKEQTLGGPWFITPGPVTRHLDTRGYYVTSGVGPDLMNNAQEAVRRMIDLISGRYGLSAEQVYMLCSVCADLRISELVNKPNWVVSLYFPRVVLE